MRLRQAPRPPPRPTGTPRAGRGPRPPRRWLGRPPPGRPTATTRWPPPGLRAGQRRGCPPAGPLAGEPGDAGLLELRAELNRQETDFAGQVADYTAVIKILAEQPAEAGSARLRRLYRHRGDAHVGLQQWAEAIDDYAHFITPETT